MKNDADWEAGEKKPTWRGGEPKSLKPVGVRRGGKFGLGPKGVNTVKIGGRGVSKSPHKKKMKLFGVRKNQEGPRVT